MNLLYREATEERQVAPAGIPFSPTPDEMARLADDQLVRATFDIPAGEVRTLRTLAARRETSETQVIRQALATESCLQRLVDRGAVLLATFGRRARELRFSQL